MTTLGDRAVRCILFDLGETLWTRVDQEGWERLEQAANRRIAAILYEHINPTDLLISDITQLGQQIRRAVERETRQLFRQAPPGHEPDFALAALKGLRSLNIPGVDATTGSAVFEALRIRIPESRTLFEDVLPTLAELQRRSFVLGVVTNRNHGGQLFLEDLQTLGLLDYFSPDHIAISADLSIRKPHPEIFTNTLKALAMAPEEAAMVGDNLHADVAGAQMLNILGIWKPKVAMRARAQAAYREAGEATATSYNDNDFLLDYIHRHDMEYYQQAYNKPQPDLIIEHLSDLLTVFQKAGKQ